MREVKRFTVEFSLETVRTMEDLKKEFGLGSVADVLRLAIQVLSYLADERRAGNKLGIISKKATGEEQIRELALVGPKI